MRRWFKHLSDAAESHNKREGKSKRSEPTPDIEEETLREFPSRREVTERAEAIGGSEPATGKTEPALYDPENWDRSSDEDHRYDKVQFPNLNGEASGSPSLSPGSNYNGE